MKRVLFMVSSMNIGGVEKSLLSLLSVIPKEKYDVTVLMLEKRGGFLKQLPSWINIEEVTWFENIKPKIMQPPKKTIKEYFENTRYIKGLNFLFTYVVSKNLKDRYVFYKEIFKDIPHNKNKYDIAIAYQGPTDIIDYYIVNRVTSEKKISWIHFDVFQHQVNTKLYEKLYNQLDNIYVVSKEAQKHLIEKFPKVKSKTSVFLNIVLPDVINEMAKEKVEFDNEYKGMKIVTVGRLSKEKGQDLAIKVLSMLRKEGYEVRWYCIGEGEDREYYETLICKYNLKQDFLLLGSAINPYPYVNQSDIYVQTSRHEGYCLTLAEAKCLRKPIVTTNFTGAYEQIIDGYNGFVAECNEESLYYKIKYLLDQQRVREEVTTNLLDEEFNNLEKVNRFLS
ncbi:MULTISPECIES: glycosyltransferase [Bacillus cereus group]|uniref:glycosyltransferase n=1 Tax=Bacillus cereus group TaxID=86661 RepID=UPI0008FE8517|nr:MULTISPECIES: glycosyltransferase [Bacillus cereus group]MDG1621872.1 glycosyltransferase [Bacillus mobilis]MDX5839691.1 glycosyltransferase [Bacillus cereus group sp. BfR-BA-01700]MED4385813.1 glycosyltransferase [Bacillus mobilis]OJE45299.1 glycosyl transferase [Bacillus mobilis]HDR7242798.1 glycosyltransferase [Bacillus mobilis]